MNFKKILYVIPALMLGSCSADDILQSEADMQQNTVTYTMTADMDAVTSRATYIEEDDCMNVKWEINDVVSVSNGTESYDFYVTKVDANTNKATLSYTGAAIPDASDFTGTATYAPRDAQKVNIQTANDNTEHLKYNETAVATLTNVNLNNASLTFRHEQTAVYKVTFTAPTNITAGSTLTMSGVGEDAALKLNFSADKDATVDCYVMAPGGRVEEGGTLKFSLEVGGFTYCRSMKCTKTGGVTYENGKYWLASLGNKLELKLIDGHEFVDLGLPSGVKWATCNVGASSPEEKGDYFSWGETQSKTEYSWSTYKWCDGTENKITKYQKYGWSTSGNNEITLYASDDAAYANWGRNWRMPTNKQMLELITNCTWTDVYVKGWPVKKVTSKINGNIIYIPYAGRNGNISFNGEYWTSTYAPYRESTGDYSEQNKTASCLNFTTSSVQISNQNGNLRYVGMSVRAVCP